MAVLLVVFYHAGFSGLRGGYVGVDVFFVISGFVITGVLLRERESSSRTSLLRFYARRCRRIIPAATLVIVVTVIATYAALGVVTGDQTAIDARWTAVFLANIHFASVGTNYLTAQQPPSPLLNFWSLAVEEQFYLVYPALFLLIAGVRTRWTLQARLAVGLVAVIAASFTISVLQTASSPTVAYFSPLHPGLGVGSRGLGGGGDDMVAEGTGAGGLRHDLGGTGRHRLRCHRLRQSHGVPGVVGGHTGRRSLPGHCRRGEHAAVGRRAATGAGPVPLVRQALVLALSLALAHPDHRRRSGRAIQPALRQNIVWLAVALAASVISFHLVENPVRHAPFGRARWASLALGAALVAVSLGVATIQLTVHSSPVPAAGSTINGGHVDGPPRHASPFGCRGPAPGRAGARDHHAARPSLPAPRPTCPRTGAGPTYRVGRRPVRPAHRPALSVIGTGPRPSCCTGTLTPVCGSTP